MNLLTSTIHTRMGFKKDGRDIGDVAKNEIARGDNGIVTTNTKDFEYSKLSNEYNELKQRLLKPKEDLIFPIFSSNS